MLILSGLQTCGSVWASLSRRKDANSQLFGVVVWYICKSIKKEGC